MKCVTITVAAALTSLILGCASTPVALAPVGPNPVGHIDKAVATGQLEVFSALQEQRDGNEFDVNPSWYQHTDYDVYNVNGKRVEHVFNTVGQYDQSPCVIPLPAGKYFVRARAQGYLQVSLPVMIETGRTTRVHLDDQWQPAKAPPTSLVYEPNGHPIGWRAASGRN